MTKRSMNQPVGVRVKYAKATFKPYHTIYGCDLAKVRPIGNVCYDLQQRSHTAIDLYGWSRYHERLENIDGKSHRRKSCYQRPMYDQLLHPTTDRTINRDGRRPIVDQSWRPIVGLRSIVTAGNRWYTINRCILRPIVRTIVASCM